jgi:hypothetical protein
VKTDLAGISQARQHVGDLDALDQHALFLVASMAPQR